MNTYKKIIKSSKQNITLQIYELGGLYQTYTQPLDLKEKGFPQR